MRYSEKQKLAAVKMVSEGHSYASVIKKFGVSRGSLKNWVRDFSTEQSFIKPTNPQVEMISIPLKQFNVMQSLIAEFVIRERTQY